MTLCYLSLGSNLNSPQRQLRQAIANLRLLPGSQVLKVASFYPNKAWGRKTQPRFYNTVVALKTHLRPEQLLRYCQEIERKQGRVRRVQWGARTLDIDIIFFGKEKIKQRNLIIPHPRYQERDFVLIPLYSLLAPEA